MISYETKALILNCIDLYNAIKDKIDKLSVGVALENESQAKQFAKELIKIDGFEFFYELERIKNGWELLSGESK